MRKFILGGLLLLTALLGVRTQAAEYIFYNPAHKVYLKATATTAEVTTMSSQATVFTLTAATSGSTTTLAYSVNGITYYLGQSGNGIYGNVSNSTSASSRQWILGSDSRYPGRLYLGNRNGGWGPRYLSATKSGVNIPYWSSSVWNNMLWELKSPTQAKLSVSASAGYGTFVAPYDVVMPNGVTAYQVGDVEPSGKLVLTAVSGTLPAGTPVLTECAAGAGHTYQGVRVVTGETSVSGLLTGVYADTQAPTGAYVLQRQNGKVGFYPVAGTRPTVKANRCYLTASVGTGVKAFFLTDDTPTSLSALEALTTGTAAIYDLQGRRLTKLQKGVNLVNGRKVLVR